MDRLHPEVLCSGGLLLLPHHRSYDLSCQTQRHSPISRSPVIRRALPCGCILAGLSPSPFHHCSFPTCNALRPRGARRPLTPSSSPPVTTFTPSGQGSALPLSTLCSGCPLLEAESHSPLDCSPPGQTRPGVAPGRGDFYRPTGLAGSLPIASFWLPPLSVLSLGSLLAALCVGVAAVVARFMRSCGVERQHLKWLA